MPDLAGFDDMSEFGDEIDDPVLELHQDAYHRLIEAPGSNMDVPDDSSIGIEDMLGGPMDPAFKARVENGLMRDDRIDAVQATITETADGAFSASIEIVADEQVLGITVDVDAAGVRRIT